jgi:DNA-binding response OmpR family regulator
VINKSRGVIEVCALKDRWLPLTCWVPCPAGKASTTDVIKGLQAGSSDYITKPFQPQEVLARIETQLRLYMGDMAALQVVMCGGKVVDRHDVWFAS